VSGIKVQPGWKIRGAGVDVTTIKLQKNNPTRIPWEAVISGAADGAEISDLTIDCNLQNQRVACSPQGIQIAGSNTRISRVKAVNWGSTASKTECFVIGIFGDPPAIKTNCIIEDCIVTRPAPIQHQYGSSAISIFSEGNGTVIRGGVVRDCMVMDVTAGTGVGRPPFFNSYWAPIVTHCQARNLAGGGAHTCYCDSWNWRDVVIEDNKFENVREGVSVGFVANHIDGLMIRSNIITVADGGVGINFWLSMKNPSQCFVTNLVISGNQIYPGMRAVNTSGLALYGTISASIINNVLQGKGSGHDFDASREVSLVPPYVGEVRIKDFTGNVNVSGVPVEQVQPRLPGH
jgi:hypothetical protein